MSTIPDTRFFCAHARTLHLTEKQTMRVAACKTTYQPARREFGALAFSTQSAQLAHDPSRIERMGNSLTRLARMRIKRGETKRWGIEAAFRDTKDLRFGMGMASIRVSTPERRDRLWLLNAFAVVLLTLLGAAGEALGYDRHLKSNTSKKRTHSLFRQGAMLYELIPMMPEPRLRPLVERFGAMLLEIPVFDAVYGIIQNEGIMSRSRPVR